MPSTFLPKEPAVRKDLYTPLVISKAKNLRILNIKSFELSLKVSGSRSPRLVAHYTPLSLSSPPPHSALHGHTRQRPTETQHTRRSSHLPYRACAFFFSSSSCPCCNCPSSACSEKFLTSHSPEANCVDWTDVGFAAAMAAATSIEPRNRTPGSLVKESEARGVVDLGLAPASTTTRFLKKNYKEKLRATPPHSFLSSPSPPAATCSGSAFHLSTSSFVVLSVPYPQLLLLLLLLAAPPSSPPHLRSSIIRAEW